MYQYTWDQIQILFFLYCFLGWVWESCFVSVKKGEWVNRGFLYGPALPIYGFGALIILGISYPVADSVPLIFVFGMAGATALEYATGALMEKLFHMRYWDYTKNRFNLHGYICLGCSLGWGVFSVLLVKVINPPVESILFMLPEKLIAPLSTGLTILISIDTMRSAQAAIDMKALMEKMSENNAAVASIREKIEELSETIDRKYPELREQVAEGREKKEELLQRFELRAQESRRSAEALRQKIETALQKPEDGRSGQDKAHLQGLKRALGQLMEEIHKIEEEAVEKKEKELRRAGSLIKRNPSLSSRHLKEALRELKEIVAERSGKKE